MFNCVRILYMEMSDKMFFYTNAWIPVMALPRIKEWMSDWPSEKISRAVGNRYCRILPYVCVTKRLATCLPMPYSSLTALPPNIS